MRGQGVDTKRAREDCRRRARKRSDRVASIQHEVVPGQHPRPAGGRRGLRQDRLLQRRCRAPIAPHAVEHPDEGQRHQRDYTRRRGQAHVSDCAQDTECNQRTPAANHIAADANKQCGHGGAGQTGPDDEPDRGRGQSDLRQIDREHDAGKAYGRRTKEPRRVNQRRIAFDGPHLE